MYMNFKFQWHEVLLKHSQAYLFTLLSMAGFMLQWQSWMVVTEITWPSKPKLFTHWCFIEKVCLLPTLEDERERPGSTKALTHVSAYFCHALRLLATANSTDAMWKRQIAQIAQLSPPQIPELQFWNQNQWLSSGTKFWMVYCLAVDNKTLHNLTLLK